MELRFLEFEIRDAEKPILARDGDRLYLSVPLPPSGVLMPRSESQAVPIEEIPSKTLPDDETPTSTALAPIEKPATPTIVIPTASMQPTRIAERFDVLGEAEGLRDGLFKVAAHAGRILQFLREVCTQQNVTKLVRSSLLALSDTAPHGEKE